MPKEHTAHAVLQDGMRFIGSADSGYILPSYGLVNARLLISSEILPMTVSFYANNLLDKVYATGEAISVGMVAAAEIGRAVGTCSRDTVERITSLIDRFGRRTPTARSAAVCELAEDLVDLLIGQRLADHARRGHEHFLRAATDHAGSRFGHFAYAVLSGLAGERVGVAAVHDQHAGGTHGEVLAAPFDRRGRGLGLREDAGHLGSRRQHHHQDIRAVAVLDARLPGRKPHARERREIDGSPGSEG